MSFLDSIKHAIVEEDDPKPTPHTVTSAAKPAATTKQATPAVTSFSSFAFSAASPAPTQGSEDFYQYLLEHYDFDKTPIGVTLQEGITSLAAVPMDDATRFKAAVAMAKTKGVTEDSVLAVPLSAARAQAVKQFLQQTARNDFPDARFKAVAGHGSQNPIAPNDTPANKAKNRRVEIVQIGSGS